MYKIENVQFQGVKLYLSTPELTAWRGKIIQDQTREPARRDSRRVATKGIVDVIRQYLLLQKLLEVFVPTVCRQANLVPPFSIEI